jgi:hypothetical protein
VRSTVSHQESRQSHPQANVMTFNNQNLTNPSNTVNNTMTVSNPNGESKLREPKFIPQKFAKKTAPLSSGVPQESQKRASVRVSLME